MKSNVCPMECGFKNPNVKSMKKIHEVLSDKLLGEYHYVLRDFQS